MLERIRFCVSRRPCYNRDGSPLSDGKKKKYFLNPISRQNFAYAFAETPNLNLQVRLILVCLAAFADNMYVCMRTWHTWMFKNVFTVAEATITGRVSPNVLFCDLTVICDFLANSWS